MNVKKIAIFASGSGTNAENIIVYFSENELIEVDSLWSNKPGSGALERAEKYGVETLVFNRQQLYESEETVQNLKERGIDLIVLAGFLWLIPRNLIDNFKIVNIHPALLPEYGGKGMYGMNVHRAVVENKDPESGITIHWVNTVYDDGKIIFQARCPVLPDDTPEDVAQKVHELEYKYYPSVIEDILKKED
ncbi:formyltetrahydrofolate-dependent phosphoribosylglycinamide formyltransferase [Tangfeifania diversioriginum]|uniref:Phosphoribosylglycinamide formyltransferase n=1 Tax=Tangfeifania diversioriginum TaxID=1168035 RepID=A0A1M6A4A3_9BACT|nr:phosphoribosylglycinamide formyltransferase [Tangfeifania diversioriginum]SHI31342.1 formyltetrahydrofolate-dependent phosphoribosylglycinamide formyltransferase [Tangfeifania diversioriginum]